MTDSAKFCYYFICTSKLLSKRKEKSLSYFERYSLLKLRTVLVVWHTHLWLIDQKDLGTLISRYKDTNIY